MSKATKAIILAGGKGVRMLPLTRVMPKPLIELNGKPIISYILENLRENEIKDITITLAYKPDLFKKILGSGEEFGVNLKYIVEEPPKGTAGFLNLMGKDELAETFFVMNSDDIFNLDFKKFLEEHKENVMQGAVVTIALTSVKDPEKSGSVRLDDKRIVEFVEKGKKPASNLISSGYYAIESSIFNYLPEKDFIMFEHDIFPQLAKEGKLFSYQDKQAVWYHVGTMEEYEMHNKEEMKADMAEKAEE